MSPFKGSLSQIPKLLMFDESWAASVQLPNTQKVNKLTKYTPVEVFSGVAHWVGE